MIMNEKYRKWLPLPLPQMIGIVIIQTVTVLSGAGYRWLIEKGMIPQGRDTAIMGTCITIFIVLCIAILLRFLQKK